MKKYLVQLILNFSFSFSSSGRLIRLPTAYSQPEQRFSRLLARKCWRIEMQAIVIFAIGGTGQNTEVAMQTHHRLSPSHINIIFSLKKFSMKCISVYLCVCQCSLTKHNYGLCSTVAFLPKLLGWYLLVSERIKSTAVTNWNAFLWDLVYLYFRPVQTKIYTFKNIFKESNQGNSWKRSKDNLESIHRYYLILYFRLATC